MAENHALALHGMGTGGVNRVKTSCEVLIARASLTSYNPLPVSPAKAGNLGYRPRAEGGNIAPGA